MSKYKFDFKTDYSQFYIGDKTTKEEIGTANFWNAESFMDRLAVAYDIMGVGIESYGHAKGEIDVLSSETINFDSSLYDHIVEGSITLHSGALQIKNCTENKVILEINIKPGDYRVRIYSSGIEDNDKKNEFYKIEIWPGDIKGRKVIKRYE